MLKIFLGCKILCQPLRIVFFLDITGLTMSWHPAVKGKKQPISLNDNDIDC